MSNPVFVIATQRSGTNFLRALLRSTGQFEDFDEILHSAGMDEDEMPNAYFDWAKHSYFRYRALKYSEDPSLSLPTKSNVNHLFDEYLEQLRSAAAEKPYFIMDVKYSSLHHFDPVWHSLSAPRYFFDILQRLECLVLHLVRLNVFNIYLSEKVAQATQRYVVKAGNDPIAPKLRLNPEIMLWNLERIEREVNMVRFDLSNLPMTCEVTYENLTSEVPTILSEEISRLQEFFQIGLRFKRTAVPQKIVRDRWSVIENVDEVKEALLSSPYNWCIE